MEKNCWEGEDSTRVVVTSKKKKFDLSYSFCNLFTLLFKVSYLVCGVYGWLNWLWDGGVCL